MAFEININPVFKGFIKSAIWCFWNTVSGLAPFLVIAFVASTILDKHSTETSKEEIEHLLNDCVILFFCSAMMGEITIEAFLSKVKFGKYSYLGFCASSFMILSLVCIIYTIIIFGNLKIHVFDEFNNMRTFQTVIVVFSLSYCLFIKTIMYIEEGKMHEKCQSLSMTSP